MLARARIESITFKNDFYSKNAPKIEVLNK